MAEPCTPRNCAQGEPGVLGQISAWLERPAIRQSEAIAAQLDFLRRAVEEAHEASGAAGAARMANVLQALGRLKRHLAGPEALPVFGSQAALAPLSAEWFDLANDGTREFELAAAVAGISDPYLGPLRIPASLVELGSGLANERGSGRPGVGGIMGTGLAEIWMAALLARLEEGAQHRLKRLPLGSVRWASVSAVCMFLWAQTDDLRIKELFLGLAEAERPPAPSGPRAAGQQDVVPPRAYALLKLGFLPEPVGGGEWPANPCFSRSRIVAALGKGDLFRACWWAAEELRAVGIAAVAWASGEGAHDAGWREAALDPHRLAAALLVPISTEEVEYLLSCL